MLCSAFISRIIYAMTSRKACGMKLDALLFPALCARCYDNGLGVDSSCHFDFPRHARDATMSFECSGCLISFDFPRHARDATRDAPSLNLILFSLISRVMREMLQHFLTRLSRLLSLISRVMREMLHEPMRDYKKTIHFDFPRHARDATCS